jgi:hypothetical protein
VGFKSGLQRHDGIAGICHIDMVLRIESLVRHHGRVLRVNLHGHTSGCLEVLLKFDDAFFELKSHI